MSSAVPGFFKLPLETRIKIVQERFGLTEEDAFKCVDNFQKRFFSQQYKRITMPEGIKLLNISMSPRSDLRIAGDIRKPKNK